MVDIFQDADDVRDVTTKRAERLLDGLLIANIGIDSMKERDLRAALHGNVESALCHEREQANGFERNCFTTRVRTSDDDCTRARFWININGYYSVRVEQWMTRVDQLNRRWT